MQDELQQALAQQMEVTAQEVVAGIVRFAQRLREHGPAPEQVHAAYVEAGQPLGPRHQDAATWYAERMMAYHLQEQTKALTIGHLLIEQAQRPLRPL